MDEFFDLEDVDTNDLIEELRNRDCIVIAPDNLNDTMKLTCVSENIDRVTLRQLQNFFNNPNKYNEA